MCVSERAHVCESERVYTSECIRASVYERVYTSERGPQKERMQSLTPDLVSLVGSHLSFRDRNNCILSATCFSSIHWSYVQHQIYMDDSNVCEKVANIGCIVNCCLKLKPNLEKLSMCFRHVSGVVPEFPALALKNVEVDLRECDDPAQIIDAFKNTSCILVLMMKRDTPPLRCLPAHIKSAFCGIHATQLSMLDDPLIAERITDLIIDIRDQRSDVPLRVNLDHVKCRAVQLRTCTSNITVTCARKLAYLCAIYDFDATLPSKLGTSLLRPSETLTLKEVELAYSSNMHPRHVELWTQLLHKLPAGAILSMNMSNDYTLLPFVFKCIQLLPRPNVVLYGWDRKSALNAKIVSTVLPGVRYKPFKSYTEEEEVRNATTCEQMLALMEPHTSFSFAPVVHLHNLRTTSE